MYSQKDEDNDWSVQDPVIMKQRISAGNTHLDKEELAKYYTKAAIKYKDNELDIDNALQSISDSLRA